MPILIEHYKNEGKKPNIVVLAQKLYQSLTPTEPSAPPPPQQFLYLKQQENHYEPSYPYDAEAMRLALLNLELQDRSLQRSLIDPPPKFADGLSSIGDNDRVRISARMEKVKLYFPAAFGGRKFTGKKNSEVGIIELLNDANNAQTVMHLTEMEFIQFLAKSMAGEAHTTMINYLDLYRRKQMSITDIYLSLTDLYFTEMRPAAALEKLQSLNDFNHSYSSLSEAHNGILYLANLASLASRSADRQEALCADYYQLALLRIMPKEYHALSSAAFEQCRNLKRADLSPHEMLSCFNKLRHPIEGAPRRTANKIDRNTDRNQTLGRKGVKMIKTLLKIDAVSSPKKIRIPSLPSLRKSVVPLSKKYAPLEELRKRILTKMNLKKRRITRPMIHYAN